MCRQWAGRTRVDIHVELMRLTLVIVSEALFRTVVEDDTATVGRALDVISRQFVGFKFPFWLPTPGNVRALWQLRKLNRIVYGFIRERAAGRTSKSARVSSTQGNGGLGSPPYGTDDLLSHLLAARDDQGRPMSERQLRDELMTVFLAGHETTAIALSFTLWLIARHADVEERLLAEYTQVLEDRAVTAADVPQLEFTRAVLQESMRLYPPVWGLGRENVAEYAIGDYVLPPRTIIFPCQFIIHRDERFYDDPERFDPDRWLRGIEARNPRYAYFPFGAGPRACIGAGFAMLEMAAVLATLLRAYRFTAVDERIELVPAITLRPRDGIQFTAERRSAAAGDAR
jgi:cytochrome P450